MPRISRTYYPAAGSSAPCSGQDRTRSIAGHRPFPWEILRVRVLRPPLAPSAAASQDPGKKQTMYMFFHSEDLVWDVNSTGSGGPERQKGTVGQRRE